MLRSRQRHGRLAILGILALTTLLLLPGSLPGKVGAVGPTLKVLGPLSTREGGLAPLGAGPPATPAPQVSRDRGSACGTTPTAVAACRAALESLSPTTSGPLPAGTPSWNVSCSTCSPIAREGPSMVYDAADGYVLLYGGLQDVSNQEPGDTWTYKAGVWTQLTPTTAPSPRVGAGMAYDAADGYVVLFGGADEHSNNYYADTWEFLGGSWTLLSPSTSPSARYFPSMTYDSADGYVLLFGGAVSTSVPLGDTWSFVGGQWTNLGTLGPPPSRYTAAMAYDAADGYTIMYGGLSGTTYESDTWEFLGGGWTQLAPATSPGKLANIGDMMVWDSSLGSVLLVGGDSGTSSCTSNTWTFKGGSWTLQGPSPSLPKRAQGGLADDPPDSTALEFSGWNCGTPITDYTDAYTYFGGFAPLSATLTATPSSTDIGHAIAFTGTAHGGFPPYAVAMRFGDGGAATSLTTSHTFSAPGSYTVWLWVNDSSSGSVTASATVLVNALPTVHPIIAPNPVDVNVTAAFASGLTGGTAPFQYGWRFGDGTNSSAAAPAHAYGALAIYTVVVWVNDSVGASTTASTTVAVDPAPTVSASARPTTTDVGLPVSFSATPGGGTPPFHLAWNFGDGGTGTGTTVSYSYTTPGNYTSHVWANDSGGGSAGALLMIVVDRAPGTPTLAASPNPADAGTSVAFSAAYGGGTPPFSNAWAFGDGSFSSQGAPTHVYVRPGNFTVRFWANDSAGASATGALSVRVNAALTLTSFQGVFASGAPGTLDLGQVLNTSLSTTGGTSPLSYAYLGTPPGCSSVDRPNLLCTPNQTGTYRIEAEVSDAAGAHEFANLTVTIAPALVLASFFPSDRQVSVGAADSLVVQASGGVAPYTFTYLRLPPGCASQDTGRLPCVPARSGMFVLEVELQDPTGALLFANSSLEVNPDPEITSFEVYPSNATWGQRVNFVAVLSGGTGTLSVIYSGYPTGCSALGATGGTCVPGVAGTFHVHLTVVDTDNREANASVVLHVAPAPSVLAEFLGAYWWGLVLVLVAAVALLVYALDRRHRRRAELGGLADGVALDGMPQAAPAPEGHPMVDDTIPMTPGTGTDARAPEPGPHPPGTEESGAPDGWKAVPLSPPQAHISSGPDEGHLPNSDTVLPSDPSPAAPVGETAPSGGSNAVPTVTPSAADPAPAAAPADHRCTVCGTPLRADQVCPSCGIVWH
ncbi:MAG: PKD domain-containing protein [Euryarchaeota archaeon]|nr:PKD domain-containing protein [Euryarchaeota archaeon]